MNPHDQEEKVRQTTDSDIQSAPHEEGRQHVSLADAPVHDEVKLPPRHTVVDKVERIEEDEVRKVKVPHVHVKEVFEEVDVPVHKRRYTKQPQVDVLYRRIKIPKPIKTRKEIEVPQLHVVDRVTEKFIDIEKERVVQRPKYIIQERIIPFQERKIEEYEVKIPKEEFEKLVNKKLDGERRVVHQEEDEEVIHAPWANGQDSAEFETNRMPMGTTVDPKTGIKFRHVPKPVEIPIIHYKPKPVERIVDRYVPIPVELDLTQEFQMPTLVPLWNEVPVPVHVTRRIEKPVPAECFMNRAMLSTYLKETREVDLAAAARAGRMGDRQLVDTNASSQEWDQIIEGRQSTSIFDPLKCCRTPNAFTHPVRVKMTEAERLAAGVTDRDLETAGSFNSRNYSMDPGMNRSWSRSFLGKAFTMRSEAQPDSSPVESA